MRNKLTNIPLTPNNVEGINTEVKQHICSLNYKDWSLAEIAQNLYQVSEIFNRELFNGVLSTPIITISRLRVTTLGCFVIGRNDFGAKNHIKLNSKHMNRTKIELYETLLHEMLHQSEYEIHNKKPTRGNYHSSFFQVLSRNLGIPSNDKGVSIGIIRNSPFIGTLLKHNLISENELDENTEMSITNNDEYKPVAKGFPRSKLLKFSCSCTNVRVAVLDFKARCLKCGQEFELSEKSAF